MAARSVIKLFTKTCAYSVNSNCPPNLTNLPETTCKQNRPCSSPYHKKYLHGERFFQLRNISKSLENLRESRLKEEEYYEEEDRHSSFDVDLSMRDPAKEFKEKPVEEKTEEGNPIYELAEGSRNEENYYDVLNRMKIQERNKVRRLFMHLQPSNLKPFGSNENLFASEIIKSKFKIVYPINRTQSRGLAKESYSNVQQVSRKDYSSFSNHNRKKNEIKAVANPELKHRESNKKTYSTSFFRKTKTQNHKRRSSSAQVKLKQDTVSEPPVPEIKYIAEQMEEDANRLRMRENLGRRKSSKALLIECAQTGTLRRRNPEIDTNNTAQVRAYNTRQDFAEESKTSQQRNYSTRYVPPPLDKCSDYVTVKLSELQEECRKAGKCRPKKISFGRLPKLKASDCPCIEDIPLKEGKPLLRLKKRFDVKEPDEQCPVAEPCPPRADDNLCVEPKSLPVLKPKYCPCEEIEMTDFVIKRLPKKKIPEPKRICPCTPETCPCPPRADGEIIVKKKSLPKLATNNCPCIEEIALKTVPLKRLKPVVVKEPERICKPPDYCDPTIRADHFLVVEPKTLPKLEAKCACVPPPPMDEGKPFPRLKKIKKIQPSKDCGVKVCDPRARRADENMKVGKKKLPKFVPQECPCIEAVIPDKEVKLKRLPPKDVPEPPRICPDKDECGPRADDNMCVEPKKLPVLETKECPCVQEIMKDCPPLKRLHPKPVVEKKKECKLPCKDKSRRSDENMKVKPKNLPPLPPGNCPCIERPVPEDVKPLARLKPKPVSYERICPTIETCTTERADEFLKVEPKKLPVLEAPDCPCYEPEPLEDVPLKRLHKMDVPEPERICPKSDICDEIPRADEDDWMYWKRVEVKPPECDQPAEKGSKGNKRGFCTFTKFTRNYSTTSARNYSSASTRKYSTAVSTRNEFFKMKYDVYKLSSNSIKNKTNNIIIDIKPSAPLILSQKPLETKTFDDLLNGNFKPRCVRTRSEPIDCVAFIIYKSNNLTKSKTLREGFSDPSLVCNTINRFISTCSALCEYSASKDKLKDESTSLCECPPNTNHLQPKYPIIPEKETFIQPFPDDFAIEASAKKSRRYCRTRKEEVEDCNSLENVKLECEDAPKVICEEEEEEIVKSEEKKMSLWEKVVNYFKAKPCPSPQEFEKMKLKEEAERAASKAGLCLYDPKEMLRKNEKELPKVITADSKDECTK